MIQSNYARAYNFIFGNRYNENRYKIDQKRTRNNRMPYMHVHMHIGLNTWKIGHRRRQGNLNAPNVIISNYTVQDPHNLSESKAKYKLKGSMQYVKPETAMDVR